VARRGGWKPVHRYESAIDEPFNLDDDLAEVHDRSVDRSDIPSVFRQNLMDWQQKIAAVVPVADSQWERLLALVPSRPDNAGE
jgi:hypothetical protein